MQNYVQNKNKVTLIIPQVSPPSLINSAQEPRGLNLVRIQNFGQYNVKIAPNASIKTVDQEMSGSD